jgi:hypothetical protein
MLLDRLLGSPRLALAANAEHHLGGDREQQQSARNAERRKRDPQPGQPPIAEEGGADQNRSGDQRGADADAVPGPRRKLVGDRQKGRRQAGGVHHDQERHEGRDEVIERHHDGLTGAAGRVNRAVPEVCVARRAGTSLPAPAT